MFVALEVLQELQRVLAEARADLGEVLMAHLPHLVIELEFLDRSEDEALLAFEMLAHGLGEGCSLARAAAAEEAEQRPV